MNLLIRFWNLFSLKRSSEYKEKLKEYQLFSQFLPFSLSMITNVCCDEKRGILASPNSSLFQLIFPQIDNVESTDNEKGEIHGENEKSFLLEILNIDRRDKKLHFEDGQWRYFSSHLKCFRKVFNKQNLKFLRRFIQLNDVCLCEIEELLDRTNDLQSTLSTSITPMKKCSISFVKKIICEVDENRFNQFFTVIEDESNSAFSIGILSLVMDRCKYFWDGNNMVELDKELKLHIFDHCQQLLMNQECNVHAICYSPIQMNQMAKSLKDFTELPVNSSRFFRWFPHGTILMGIVITSHRPLDNMILLVHQLRELFIRFIYFSEETTIRTNTFASKLGLETGWNCHICLDENEDDNEKEIANFADLPLGVSSMRNHIAKKDNVPLLVSIFSQTTEESRKEMMRIMIENSEKLLHLSNVNFCCPNNYENSEPFTHLNCTLSPKEIHDCLAEVKEEKKRTTNSNNSYSIHHFNQSSIYELIALIHHSRSLTEIFTSTFYLFLHQQFLLFLFNIFLFILSLSRYYYNLENTKRKLNNRLFETHFMKCLTSYIPTIVFWYSVTLIPLQTICFFLFKIYLYIYQCYPLLYRPRPIIRYERGDSLFQNESENCNENLLENNIPRANVQMTDEMLEEDLIEQVNNLSHLNKSCPLINRMKPRSLISVFISFLIRFILPVFLFVSFILLKITVSKLSCEIESEIFYMNLLLYLILLVLWEDMYNEHFDWNNFKNCPKFSLIIWAFIFFLSALEVPLSYTLQPEEPPNIYLFLLLLFFALFYFISLKLVKYFETKTFKDIEGRARLDFQTKLGLNSPF
ncbi:hypothetical protein SNEBB_003910 [Seison nebaliae]|nr:hypothetical protein SNEBB_003910 [Seison nebaliae]